MDAKLSRRGFLGAVGAAGLTTFAGRSVVGKTMHSLDTVVIRNPGLYPEGLDFDYQRSAFIVTSLTEGTVGTVTDDGQYKSLVDDEDLISTVGVFVDEPRNRILVANADEGIGARTSDATVGQLAQLGIYNRESGRRLALVDLSDLTPDIGHLANDMTVDERGTAYVTDTYAPLIYRVDSEGNASVFLEDERLGAPEGALGLNGIVYHPDGFLLVAKSDEGLLFRVPLCKPTSFDEVAIQQDLRGADGLELLDRETLALVSSETVFRLSSSSGWSSANVTGAFETGGGSPTTIVERESTPYVLYSHLDRLLSGTTPAVEEYQIQEVRFTSIAMDRPRTAVHY